MLRKAAVAMAAGLALMGTAGAAQAKTTLKLATLAPKQSPWGKVFTTWSKAVDQKTKGNVEISWLWNGIAGPEDSVVGKMKSGQVGGAALTAAGLASIHKPITALGMPGAFKTWADLDRARAALRPQFDAAINEAGFDVVGWGDVGQNRGFSKGFQVKLPNDLKGKSPISLKNDLIGPKLYEAIGGITAKPAGVNDILPLLRTGSVNVIGAPSLAVEQLQWAPNLDHMNTGVSGFGTGALIMSREAQKGMSADEKAVVLETGKIAANALLKRIRGEDDAAYARLRKKMKVHEQTPAERAEWEKVWKKACERIKGALPGTVLKQIGYC